MQDKKERRTNRERSDTTRAELMAAARRLFIEKGYADTATPDIVAAAGLTRGALYHHFEDKKALFCAVAEAEAEAVAAETERAVSDGMRPREALIKGGDAYLSALALPGRTRLLLLDGPSVLGRTGMDEIDNRHGTRSLRGGILFAVRAGDLPQNLPIEEATQLLASAYDRAALSIETGGDPDEYRRALALLIDGLAALA
ncbi:TetR/AcrR family transcriptional regulator [Mesorhizobium sp. ASY16-5R]|uniref:TetR/AcrR family transcriptional regulator n=1 Tax=Mesorhizobium sp. ASY16-5R TaxID=3445772 RepID=UPI003F9F9B2B